MANGWCVYVVRWGYVEHMLVRIYADDMPIVRTEQWFEGLPRGRIHICVMRTCYLVYGLLIVRTYEDDEWWDYDFDSVIEWTSRVYAYNCIVRASDMKASPMKALGKYRLRRKSSSEHVGRIDCEESWESGTLSNDATRWRTSMTYSVYHCGESFDQTLRGSYSRNKKW